jgi:hypothetical protein
MFSLQLNSWVKALNDAVYRECLNRYVYIKAHNQLHGTQSF